MDQSDCRKYEFIPRKLVVNHNRNKQHGSKSTSDNLQTWPLEPAEESPCFLRGRLEWVTEAKSVNIGYNFDLRSHIISKRGNGKCWWMTKYQLVSSIQCFLGVIRTVSKRKTLSLTHFASLKNDVCYQYLNFVLRVTFFFYDLLIGPQPTFLECIVIFLFCDWSTLSKSPRL